MDSADEWTVDVLDVGAYLDRIGVDEDGLAADVATLQRLHRAHVASIPFENLDVILGRGVRVDLEHVQDKLVHSGRGGYCYEHAVLFAAALMRLGFAVVRQLGRISGDPARPNSRTHMSVVVDVGGERWLADTGFGSGLLEAIRLEPGVVTRQGDWAYRLARPQRDTWELEELVAGSWAGQYTFDEQPQHHSDVVVSNHFTATWPTSPFVQRPVVVRKDEHVVRRLLGRELTSTTPRGAGGPERVDDLDSALRDLGLALPAADVAALEETLR